MSLYAQYMKTHCCLFFVLFGIIVTSSVLPVRAFNSREHYFQEVIYCVKV